MEPTAVLNAAIQAKGISDKELSKASGVHVITVRRYLSGEIKRIGTDNARKLAAALDIDFVDLIGGRSSSSAA